MSIFKLATIISLNSTGVMLCNKIVFVFSIINYLEFRTSEFTIFGMAFGGFWLKKELISFDFENS